jgi:hypothetical protein
MEGAHNVGEQDCPVFLACAPGVAVVRLLGPDGASEKVRPAPSRARAALLRAAAPVCGPGGNDLCGSTFTGLSAASIDASDATKDGWTRPFR